MMDVALWVFWLAAAFLAYIYVGFAALVAVVGAVRRRVVAAAPITPPLSLIIAAYNEEETIAERLDNALALDYPRDRLEIIVASDGSTDRTDAIAGAYGGRGVTLLSLPRQGKIHALAAAVGHATGEVLVFSDANTMCHPGALRAMARNFADPAVGGVAGHTTYELPGRGESSSRGENLYWNYDTWLKMLESRTGSVVSAHGGLYAIRRSLYRPSPDPAVTDDFAISTCPIVQGYRLVFEPAAMATEVAVAEAPREFRRRVRLMTRGLRGVLMRRRLLNPFRYGFYAVTLFSHKLARRLAPIALVLLAISSAALWQHGAFYRVAAIGQALFYGTAAAGFLLRGAAVGALKIAYVPFYFCLANAACAVALVQVARGTRIERWQPQRHAVSPQ